MLARAHIRIHMRAPNFINVISVHRNNSPKSLGQHMDNHYLLPFLMSLCFSVFIVFTCIKNECTEISSKGWLQSKNKPTFIFTLWGDLSEFSKFSAFICQNTARFWKYLRKSISRSRWPKNTRIN